MIRLALLLLLVPAAAHAECAREDRVQMTRLGYSQAQIESLCSVEEDPFPLPEGATANYCVTDSGFCPLIAPEPAGKECTCATQFGPLTGVTE
jgi:hypothetical protein